MKYFAFAFAALAIVAAAAASRPSPGEPGATATVQAAIPRTHFATGLDAIVASGAAQAGDAGAGCRYIRGTSSGPNATADADGNYWQIAETDISSAACWGALANGAVNDNPAIRKALAYLGGRSGELRLPYTGTGVYSLDTETDKVPATVGIVCDAGVTLKPNGDGGKAMFVFSGRYGGVRGCTFLGDTRSPLSNIPIVIETADGGQTIERNHIVGFRTAIAARKGNAVKLLQNRVEYCGDGACVVVGGAAGMSFGDATWDDNVVLPHSKTGIGLLIEGGANAQYMHRLEINGGNVGLRAQLGAGPATPQNIWCWNCNIDAAETAEVDLAACWFCEFHGSNLSGTVAGPGLLIRAAAPGAVDGVSCFDCQIMGNGAQGVEVKAGRNIRFHGGTIAENSRKAPGTHPAVEVGAEARGVFWMQGVMAGLSAPGRTGWGHNLNGQSYAVLLRPGCLADAAPDPVAGVLVIQGNFFTGNMAGGLSGACDGASASTLKPNF